MSDSRCSASSLSFSRFAIRASSVLSIPCQFSLAMEYCVCSVSICLSSLAWESPPAPDDASSACTRMASSLPSITCSSAFISSSRALVRSLARSAFSFISLSCIFALSATRFLSTWRAASDSSNSAIRFLCCSRAWSLTFAVIASACSVAFDSFLLSSETRLSFELSCGFRLFSSFCDCSRRRRSSSFAF